MDIELTPTPEGLEGEFKDYYGFSCSIADGRKHGSDTPLLCLGDEEHRMVLTQDMAAALLPLLQQFVATGRLAQEAQDEQG